MKIFRRIRIELMYAFDNLHARCQRFMRGYSYGDARDIDIWFMDTIKPMLIFLRDTGCGVPNDLYLEGAENERAAWEAVLTEMVECLELMNEGAAQKHLGVYDEEWSKESYKMVNDLMEEKKNRFFELFSKHFYSLWD